MTFDNLTTVLRAVTPQTQLWEPENVRDHQVSLEGEEETTFSPWAGGGGLARGRKELVVLHPISAALGDCSSHETLLPSASEKGPHQWGLAPVLRGR